MPELAQHFKNRSTKLPPLGEDDIKKTSPYMLRSAVCCCNNFRIILHECYLKLLQCRMQVFFLKTFPSACCLLSKCSKSNFWFSLLKVVTPTHFKPKISENYSNIPQIFLFLKAPKPLLPTSRKADFMMNLNLWISFTSAFRAKARRSLGASHDAHDCALQALDQPSSLALLYTCRTFFSFFF